ncbi:MAG: response regulator [Caproiciproducens sp.]|nr:response regulator [Caproiciproducens sp.]
MKILIADDEMKICQLISHLIDWDAMGLEVVNVVNDGKAAYESICKNHPDIVITDIRMPNLDGLELIRLCKEKFPNVYFIIISGYGEFSYAKNAIKYGVEDYLLKPIKKKELEGALTKIKEKYDTNYTDEQEKERLRSIANTSKDKIQQSFLTNMIRCANDSNLAFDFRMEEINNQYQCRFQQGLFTVVNFQLYQKKEAMLKDSLDFLAGKLQEIVKEELKELCTEFISITSEGTVICLMNTEGDHFSKVKKQFHKIKINISNEIFSNIVLIIGVGNSYPDLNSVVRSYKEAEISLLNRIGYSNDYVIEYSKLKSFDKNISDFIDIKMRNDIIAAQERMDVNAILHCIDVLRQQLTEYKTDSVLIYNCFLELIEVLQFGSKNYGVLFQKLDLEEYKRKYKSILTFDELFDWVNSEIIVKYRKFTDQKKVAEKKPIRVAKQYIYDNYNKNLTLESVSEFTGFNPTYFSVFFKKETGKNFSEYLTELRIKNAKSYIVSTDMDIADIAAEVGYNDLKYFSKLFKKVTGINPTEYRKLYG